MASYAPEPALLFCPGDRPERFEKAADRADAVVIDLEDAVSPENKDAARAAVVASQPQWRRGRTIVRINAADTPWHRADVATLSPLEGIVFMLPKAESASQVTALAPVPVIALCESAAGVLQAPGIARASNCGGLMWGSEDLASSTGARASRDPAGQLTGLSAHARHSVLLAAAAAHRPAYDSVFVDFDAPEALELEASEAARMGFAGKACIHPSQVARVRRAFRPTDDEIAWAAEVLRGAEGNEGVFRLRGTMIDAPVVAQARRVVHRATHTKPTVDNGA